MLYMANSTSFLSNQIVLKEAPRIIPSKFGQKLYNKTIVVGRTDDKNEWRPITIAHHEHTVLR